MSPTGWAAEVVTVDTGVAELLAEIDDGIGILTLNRPERRNAVTPEMLDGIGDVLDRFDNDPHVRVVLLTGAGNAFCAGGDVAKFAARGGDVAVEGETEQQWCARRFATQAKTVGQLHAMSTPTIGVLPGATAGAGLGLALACDLRVGCPETLITTAFVKVGLSGDFGVNWLLRQLVGPSRARRLMFLSERINGEQAADLGLIDRLVPRDELTTAAREIAASLAAVSPRALAAIKANLLEAGEIGLEEAMRREILRYRACADSAEHRAAVRAFVGG